MTTHAYQHIPLFDQAEIAYARNLWDQESARRGLTDHGELSEFRKVDELAVEDAQLTVRLRRLFEEINQQYQFDIDGETELRLLSYTGNVGGVCGLHQDSLWTTPTDRKLTALIMLSSPDEFLGGEFYFHGHTVEQFLPGDALVFPSFMHHGVLPVTRGTRLVLLAWQHGAAWK